MKLIIIAGSHEATFKFAKQFVGQLRTTLISNDIHELIHARRSANPPQYALADNTLMTTPECQALHRHFPDHRGVDVPDDLSDNEILFAVRKAL